MLSGLIDMLYVQQIYYLKRVGILKSYKQIALLIISIVVAHLISTLTGIDGTLFQVLIASYIYAKDMASWLVGILVVYTQVAFILIQLLLFWDLPIFIFNINFRFMVGHDKIIFVSFLCLVILFQSVVLWFFEYITKRFNIIQSIVITKRFKLLSVVFLSELLYLLVLRSETINEHYRDSYIFTLLTICFLTGIMWFMVIKINMQKINDSKLRVIETDYVNRKMLHLATDRFRHDFKGIMIALRGYVKAGELEKANELLDEIIGKTSNLLTSNNVNQINTLDDIILKSLMLDFVEKCEKEKITVVLEIDNEAQKKIYEMSRLDLSRCITILLNNAFEAEIEFDDDSKREIFVKIQVGITFEFLIKNNYNTQTQKKNHQGYGLKNLNSIVSEYSNVQFHMIKSQEKVSSLLKIN